MGVLRFPASGVTVSGQDRRLVVVRHGRTAWNATGRFQGQANPPLDGTGWAQAATAADQLSRLMPAVIVASDLLRAAQTAGALSQRCGVAFATDHRLREVALGLWEGLTTDEAAVLFPEEYARWLAGHEVSRGGGEEPAVAGARAAAALLSAVATCPAGGTVIAVSHGLALQSAIRVLDAMGVVTLHGPAPHLANGEWIALAADARVAAEESYEES